VRVFTIRYCVDVLVVSRQRSGADPAIGGPGGRLPLELGFCAFTVRNCTKFGLLTLRIITKIVAIRCQILRLKCTKFDFGWAPPALLREFTALPRHPN